jgi:hypothetical protein
LSLLDKYIKMEIILARHGVDMLHIKRLVRWESLEMVERYARSIKFGANLMAHNPEVVGSNPTPATKILRVPWNMSGGFS